MNVLAGRERRVFRALAEALLDEPTPTDLMMARAAAHLSRCTPAIRIFFRAALLLFEWGTLWLVTGSGRFEHFSRLPVPAKRRYARLWMNHKFSLFRQIFLFLRLMVLATFYDDRRESARVGYAPKWLA